MLQEFEALPVLVERELHFAHRLPELQVGFLDAIEHRVKIGFEQPRESCDECHLACSIVAERRIDCGSGQGLETGRLW